MSPDRKIVTRIIPADGGSGLTRELMRCGIEGGVPVRATGIVATGLLPSDTETIIHSVGTDVTAFARSGRAVAYGTREALIRWCCASPEGHPFFEGAARALALSERDRYEVACRGGTLRLGGRTAVMGILNVTPDSFSDGGEYFDEASSCQHALQMASDGADIIDIGGMSTRPGSDPVKPDEEIRRVVPVIRALAGMLQVPISIDTCRAVVAREAIAAGADIVNDVTALGGDPQMVEVLAETGTPAVLMHIKGTPKGMQTAPAYDDLLDEVTRYFLEAVSIAERHGVKREKLLADPGIGFGKTLEHNLELLDRLGEFRGLGLPVLVGTSRKSFIGMATGARTEDRLPGTAASVALAIARKAHVVRVHDVKEMVQAARLADAIMQGRPDSGPVWIPADRTGAS